MGLGGPAAGAKSSAEPLAQVLEDGRSRGRAALHRSRFAASCPRSAPLAVNGSHVASASFSGRSHRAAGGALAVVPVPSCATAGGAQEALAAWRTAGRSQRRRAPRSPAAGSAPSSGAAHRSRRPRRPGRGGVGRRSGSSRAPAPAPPPSTWRSTEVPVVEPLLATQQRDRLGALARALHGERAPSAARWAACTTLPPSPP